MGVSIGEGEIFSINYKLIAFCCNSDQRISKIGNGTFSTLNTTGDTRSGWFVA